MFIDAKIVVTNLKKFYKFYFRFQSSCITMKSMILPIHVEILSEFPLIILSRYKFVGHVVLGEHIGGGFHSGMKCCWDADSDMYATYTYLGVRTCQCLSCNRYHLISSFFSYLTGQPILCRDYLWDLHVLK